MLDTGPLTVSAGRTYTIRLDVVGSTLRVYVNSAQHLEATDTSFPKGRYGLVTVKTAARFDDFLAAQP